MQSETYDLVIFDQCAPEKPEQMPLANTLFIGRLPPLAGLEGEVVEGTRRPAPQIIDWQRSHPLLNLVELGNVGIVDSLIVAASAGGKVLIDSTKGPLLAIAPRDGFEDAVLGFEIVGHDADGETTVNTNWPRRLQLPQLLPQRRPIPGRRRPTDAATSRSGPARPSSSTCPSEPTPLTVIAARRLDPRRRGARQPASWSFHETDQLGVYEVQAGGKLAGRFAVNLFDRDESDVRLRARQDGEKGLANGRVAVDRLRRRGGRVAVVADAERAVDGLLLAALAVLVLEWYIYNRRVYV